MSKQQPPLTIGDVKVHCVKDVPTKKKVLRTWKERLSISKDELFFFNPFNKYKEVVEYQRLIPDGEVIYSGNNVYCNEYTFNEVRKKIL